MKSFNTLEKEALMEEISSIYEQLESIIKDCNEEYSECLESDDFHQCLLDADEPHDKDIQEVAAFTKEIKNFLDKR